MAEHIGKQAIVIGAGMAGLPVARVLSDFFDKVIVLESDALPVDAVPRTGTPQARHLHALLAGGQRALDSLFPGFTQSLAEAGAQPMPVSMSLLWERPGLDPLPFRDFGFRAYSMTRPLVEWVVRRRAAAIGNIEIREGWRAQSLLMNQNGTGVREVSSLDKAGQTEEIAADLVIDCSSHGQPTLNLLTQLGLPVPHEEQICVNMGYATAMFEIPADAPTGWRGVMTFPHPPANRIGAALLPVEGGAWILSAQASHGVKPPDDDSRFLEFVGQLRTPTIYNAIKGAKRRGEIARYGLKASRWRRFDKLEQFPAGLLPFGDTVCRFNPIYGQGMSVAAQEAVLLQRLLQSVAGKGDGLGNLACEFLTQMQPIIDAPWAMAAVPDFLDPLTTGDRPADVEGSLKFGAAVTRLAYRDPVIHQIMTEVQHLLKPRSAYLEREIMERIQAEMAETVTAMTW